MLSSATATATAVVTVIPVAAAVPLMVMLKLAAISVPIPSVEHPSVVARLHPTGILVRRPSPVTLMPRVTLSYRVPITLEPHELWTWLSWQHTNHAGARRSAHADSDGILSPDGYAGQ